MKPQKDNFFRITEEAFYFVIHRIKLTYIFVIPLALAILLLKVADFETFVSFGGIFLRYEDLTINQINPLKIGYTLLFIAITSYLVSIAMTGFTLLAFHKRTRSISSLILLKKEFINYTNRLFIVNLFYSFFFIAVFTLGRITLLAPIVHLINIVFGIIMLFVPAAIVIEETKPFTAIVHSLRFIKNNLMMVLKYITAIILTLALQLVLITTGDFYEIFSLIYTNLIVTPFFTVLAALIYLEKYSIAKRTTHL